MRAVQGLELGGVRDRDELALNPDRMRTVRQAINGAAKSNNNAVAPNADPIAAKRIVQAGDYAQKSAPLQAADASGTVRNTFVSSQLNARGNPAVGAPTLPLHYDPSAHVNLHVHETDNR